MIIFIAGCSHTGKTALAQKLLEKYKIPYLSIDNLKMGLIRSGYTKLAPEDDAELTAYLWPIIQGIVKTAIENRQNLVVEGCYIPFDWKAYFTDAYAEQICYHCLIMTREYIEKNFAEIKRYANVIEKRGDDSFCTQEMLIRENSLNLEMCQKYNCNYILINDSYQADIVL